MLTEPHLLVPADLVLDHSVVGLLDGLEPSRAIRSRRTWAIGEGLAPFRGLLLLGAGALLLVGGLFHGSSGPFFQGRLSRRLVAIMLLAVVPLGVR